MDDDTTTLFTDEVEMDMGEETYEDFTSDLPSDEKLEAGDDVETPAAVNNPAETSLALTITPIESSVKSPRVAAVDRVGSTVIRIESLLKAISETVAFSTLKNYNRLLEVASHAHQQLMELGTHHDLRGINNNDNNTTSKEENKESSLLALTSSVVPNQGNDSNNDQMIGSNDKDKLRSLGRTLWSQIRKHSTIFQDYVAPVETFQNDETNEDLSSSQDVKKLHELRATASGYIRSLTGRLILMDCIETKGKNIPVANSSSTSNSMGGDSSNHSISTSEMEFGLKCFARAGRALLTYTTEPTLAFSTLSLATSFWDAMISMWSTNASSNDQSSPSKHDVIVFVKNCADEALDAFSLRVESASLIPPSQAKSLEENSFSSIKEKEEASSSCLVIAQLQLLNSFVGKVLGQIGENENQLMIVEGGNGIGHARDDLIGIISHQQILPSVARTCYKHGNRLARLSEFPDAQTALDMALNTTKECLHQLHQDMERHEPNNTNGNYRQDQVSTNDSVVSSLQIQQQEMLVVTKQCLYVLCHVHHSQGISDKARACLDQIETLVLEQAKHDEEIFQETMTWLSKSNESSISSNPFSASAFALEGPKQQDMADIRVRAQAARAKAKHLELIEHSNLAFSKIMVSHNAALPGPTDEEELMIDEQIKLLAELSNKQFSPSSTVTASSRVDSITPLSSSTPSNSSQTTESYELVLAAVKATFVRRLTRQKTKDKDPYSILFQIYHQDHKMHLHIALDLLSAVLTTIQEVREKKIEVHGQSTSDLDERAIEAGKDIKMKLQKEFTSSIQSSTSDPRRLLETASHSTLFTTNQRSDLKDLIEEAQTQFARAVSFYHHLDHGHNQTIEWCDLLLSILPLSQTRNATNNGNNSEKNFIVSKSDTDKTVSGIMSIKAYSLTMNESIGSGLKIAREAWEMNGGAIGGLVTLFHCSLNYQLCSDDHSEGCSFQRHRNTLLELDNAISTYLSSPCSASSLSNDIQQQELLNAFPMLCNICKEKNDGDKMSPLIFALQQRWVNLLAQSTQMMNAIDSNTANKCNPSGECSLFEVFCPCLVTFENILCNAKHDQGIPTSWHIENYNTLDKTMDGILRLLLQVRNLKQHNASTSYQGNIGTEGQAKLIWDNSMVKTMVGNAEDCLWIAEQLWNIAMEAISMNVANSETIDHKWYAAQFLSKAHDFALLSEEEEGAMLTQGLLACEDFDGSQYKKSFSFDKEKLRTTDICSEFSAQCLLVCIGNVLEIVNQSSPSSDKPQSTEIEGRLSKTMGRLLVCFTEVNSLDSDIGNKLEKSIVWLALSLLVAMRDDVTCHESLINGGLSKKIETEFLTYSEDQKTPQRIIINPLSHAYSLACSAERNYMPQTSKTLFQLCILEMNRTSTYQILSNSNANSSSIGFVQKKIIQLSFSVIDVVSVMEDVQKTMEACGHSNTSEEHDSMITSNKGKIHPYTIEELDYFTIEAHNKAVSLMYIGDISNAEKLLAIALNLVPFCGNQVESYAGEIRRTYRSVMERKSAPRPHVSMSSESLIKLFAPLH